MSARPFPSLKDYRSKVATLGVTCTLREVEAQGEPFLVATFRAEGGAEAVEIAANAQDPLMSATIARLDRRLGINSGMFT